MTKEMPFCPNHSISIYITFTRKFSIQETTWCTYLIRFTFLLFFSSINVQEGWALHQRNQSFRKWRRKTSSVVAQFHPVPCHDLHSVILITTQHSVVLDASSTQDYMLKAMHSVPQLAVSKFKSYICTESWATKKLVRI